MTCGPTSTTYLTTKELAELTRTQPQTWRKKRWQGGGPRFIKLGNRCLYRRADVEEWLSDRSYSSTAEQTVALEAQRRRGTAIEAPGGAQGRPSPTIGRALPSPAPGRAAREISGRGGVA